MKHIITITVFMLVGYAAFAQTAEESSERPSTFALSISQENAFGFYPGIFGSFGLNQSSDITYYSLFWTNPSLGNLKLHLVRICGWRQAWGMDSMP